VYTLIERIAVVQGGMMRGLLITGFLAMLGTPVASIAQTSFNGTWKVDFNPAMPKKINVWLLQNGSYKCTSCSPIVDVRADGKDQPVKGQPYDTISVRIVDSRTVEEIEKKNGSVVSYEKFTVSHDGNTVTDEFGNWKLIMSRVEKALVGAHELSGSWQPLKMESISDNELLVTYKLEGEVFSMSRPTGQSYSAKLNGADAPYKGDSDTNGVALKRIDNNTIEETDKLNGKVVSVTRLTVAPDGKSMTVSVKDLQDGSTNQFAMQKQ
jgi:hypothetical protein